MTRTFFTSTRFLLPAMAPLARYACALGASWPVILHTVELLNERLACTEWHECWLDSRRLVVLPCVTNGRAVLEKDDMLHARRILGERPARRIDRAIAAALAATLAHRFVVRPKLIWYALFLSKRKCSGVLVKQGNQWPRRYIRCDGEYRIWEMVNA